MKAPDGPRFRVLIADDAESNRKLAALLVERLGHEPETATNGREAVDRAMRDRPDVIFMDLEMPGMDGFEAARRIRELTTEGRSPHIVALTASSFEGDTQTRAMAAGMEGYIRKPFDEERLAAVLSALHAPDRSVAPDRERLHALFEDDRAAARQITEMVLRALAELLPELERAARDGDPETAALVAHLLKDKMRYVGAERLWDACAAVEAAVRAGAPLQHLQRRVARVRGEWSAFKSPVVPRRA